MGRPRTGNEAVSVAAAQRFRALTAIVGEEGTKIGGVPDAVRFHGPPEHGRTAIYYFPPRTDVPTIPSIDNFSFTHDAAHRDAPPTIELQREPTQRALHPRPLRLRRGSRSPTPISFGEREKKEERFPAPGGGRSPLSWNSVLVLRGPDKYFLYRISLCWETERLCSRSAAATPRASGERVQKGCGAFNTFATGNSSACLILGIEVKAS